MRGGHSRDDKTFKPKRSFLQGSSRDRLHEYVVKTLGSGDLRQAVKLPDGENLYEWLAVNSAFGPGPRTPDGVSRRHGR